MPLLNINVKINTNKNKALIVTHDLVRCQEFGYCSALKIISAENKQNHFQLLIMKVFGQNLFLMLHSDPRFVHGKETREKCGGCIN